MNKIKNFLHGISEKMKDRKRKLSGHGWKWYLLLTVILVVLAGGHTPGGGQLHGTGKL